MRVHVRARWQPKAGNRDRDYEDAFWPYWLDQERAGPVFRFAVADGATESSFARLWARLLVLLYCNPAMPLPADDAGQFVDRITHAGRVWEGRVYRQPLEWFALAKAERGAFSSLTGLNIRAEPSGRAVCGAWQATTIGDSCLFHVRNDQLILAAPIEDPQEFGYHPQLLSTNPAKNQPVWQALDGSARSGMWQAGDHFLLMTDALAAWFLTGAAAGGQPWRILAGASQSQAHFARWIQDRRAAGELRNDDVTLLAIRL